LFFAFFGLTATLHDVHRAQSAARRLYVYKTRRPLLELESSDTYDGFEDEIWEGHRFLYSRELNVALDANAIEVRLSGEYTPPARVKPLRYFLLREERREGKVLFDAAKVRLAEDLTPLRLSSPEPLLLQETSYFASVCTNEVADKELRLRATDEVGLRGIELCADSGVLLDLAQSECSNHVGISTLALTSDGFLVTTVQAAGSAQYARRVAPSGSGSADLDDVHRGDTLRDFVVRAMERELKEECGLTPDLSGLRTTVLGYARLVERGGKPEFFGFTVLPVPRKHVAVSRKEAVFVADVRGHRVDRRKFVHGIRTLRADAEGAFTPVMHIALLFLADALAAKRLFTHT
jgi:hypothetical protein